MQEPTLGSLEEASQNSSDLRIVLRQLIAAHGADAVRRELSSIEAARPVENPRSRGRPAGPAIDDWPALREAAAIWRRQSGGSVWPALTAVGKSLRGETESNVRRLHARLLETGPAWEKEFEHAGISDFRIGAFKRKISRVIPRSGPRYLRAFMKVMSNLHCDDPDELCWVTVVKKMIPAPITLEDIAILIQPSQSAKTFPCHLINRDSRFLLYLGEMEFSKPRPRLIISKNPITFDKLTISNTYRTVDVKICHNLPPDKPVIFDIIPYKHVNYLVPRQPVSLDTYGTQARRTTDFAGWLEARTAELSSIHD